MSPLSSGVLSVLIYTGLIAAADGITKLMASSFASAQLFAMSGLLIAGFCATASRLRPQLGGLKTTCPKAMAVRSVATVLACTCFYYAFRFLAFAEVFVFVAMMPVMAALMSGLILKERIRPVVWLAIGLGGVGLLVMQPDIAVGGLKGSALALGGVAFGTLSIVVARYISRYETNLLAQVFYPNLMLGAVMLCVLPFVWQPMGGSDLGWVAVYAVVLFGARWLLVAALRHLPAWTVTPMLNLQFVWMTLIGLFAFGEVPAMSTFLGMAVVAASSLFLVWDQVQEVRPIALSRKSPREVPRVDHILSGQRGRPMPRSLVEIDLMRPTQAWRAGR